MKDYQLLNLTKRHLMTMDANELRALADALPEGVHWSDPITPEMLAEAIKRFCAAAPAAPQAGQPIDLDAVAMQQMRRAAAESTWMPAEYSGSDWISDVCRWLRDGPPQAEPNRVEPGRGTQLAL